jgi:aminoglycoside phosphotransferase (APT) family kinase protein
MTATGTDITEDLIRELLREQRPDLAELPLERAALGWDNQMWRLGESLALRMPWVAGTGSELGKEYAWVPALAPGLPLPVPVPQYLGEPSGLFPQPWLVTTWVPGEPADRAPATRPAEAARGLAAFLGALHRAAPDEAPESHDGRGGPLTAAAGYFAQSLGSAVELGLLQEPEAVRAVWEDAAAAPRWTGPRTWLHGDLHPANVLTADGAFCGVVDFGALFAGDPALDLAAGWLLLPDGAADLFHAAYPGPLDDATLRRARGFALLKALMCLHVGDAGVHGRPGGKATWGPPARASLRRLAGTL